METSGKIQFNEGDPNHHDHHQEPQEDGGCPLRFLRTSSKFVEVPNNNFPLNTLIKFNEDKTKHHDHHQEPRKDGGCPPSMGSFLTTIFHLIPPQLSISISISIDTNFRFSEGDPSHQDHHQEPQEDGRHPPSMWRFLTTILH